MAEKMVSIAARVPHKDAEFISQLKIEGATTPSDKVRAIIAEARRRHQGVNDYKMCFDLANNLLAPFTERVRQLEMDHTVHSELVLRTLEWLPETMAFVMSSNQKLADDNLEALSSMEKGFADRVFRLMESVLQMGVTQRCPCYNTNAILDRAEPVFDLVRVIEQTRTVTKKEKK